MYSFKNDYSEGAHPQILEALVKNNLDQQPGYGYDKYTMEAIDFIKSEIKNKDVDIHLISGGTQTNLIAISGFLRPWEACVCVESGHIAVHETGAIESTGHSIKTMPSEDGKITIEMIEGVLSVNVDEHSVLPKLVYISNPTELGTLYSRDELKALYEFCKSKDLYLYADGARLGSAVCADGGNITMADMCEYTDAFFIGATKNGALLGEALVIKNNALKSNMKYNLKQKGGLLAKGRLLGIQFRELFEDGLYFDLASHANRMADKLRQGLKDAKAEFFAETITNQVFPILTNSQIEKLSKEFEFYEWARVSKERAAVRLVTSWATREDMVDRFISML